MTDEQRFLGLVYEEGPLRCWLWRGGFDRQGQPSFSFRSDGARPSLVVETAQRWSFTHFWRPIPCLT